MGADDRPNFAHHLDRHTRQPRLHPTTQQVQAVRRIRMDQADALLSAPKLTYSGTTAILLLAITSAGRSQVLSVTVRTVMGIPLSGDVLVKPTE